MAEERAMDRGASAALKNQDLTDGIYEDAKTDAARFGASNTSSSTTAASPNAAFNAGAASGTDSISGQSEAAKPSGGSEFHHAVQSAADKVLGSK